MKPSPTAENNRVVLITGNSSKWYERAIFFIKKDAGRKQLPKDFITEAEEIINDYMKSLTNGEMPEELITETSCAEITNPYMLPITQSLLAPPVQKMHEKKWRSWLATFGMVAASGVVWFIASRLIR